MAPDWAAAKKTSWDDAAGEMFPSKAELINDTEGFLFKNVILLVLDKGSTADHHSEVKHKS